jgi:acyl carrier protein
MDRVAFVTKLTAALERPAGSLSEASSLDVKGWDSIELVSVIAMVDEELGVSVSGEDLGTCNTVAALLDMLAAKVASSGAH